MYLSIKLYLIWISFDCELKDLIVFYNFIIILLKSKRIVFFIVMSVIWKIINILSKVILDEFLWYFVNLWLFWVNLKFFIFRFLVLESSKGEFYWYFD